MNKVPWLFCFIVAAYNSLLAQSPSVAAFNTLLRDFDLNDEIQNGYAITATEYDQLLRAWQNLAPADKRQLDGFESSYWKNTYVPMLLFDFFIGSTWEGHVQKMTRLGASGLALTLSRHKSPISIDRARQNLADLLHKGPSMFNDGRFQIPDDIKTAARARAGEKAAMRLEKWEELINRLQPCANWEKIETINRFFNQSITASADMGTAKGYDYWQSPIETLVRGQGDCDDYVVAKYISLRLLGISAEQLRLGVATQAEAGGHAVLLYFSNQEKYPWVLDNLGSTRLGSDAEAILRLNARTNFDGMKLLWGMNEKLLTRFQDDLSEEKVSTHPYEKFFAAATAFVNSYRLLPPSAWGQCEPNEACICRRIGMMIGMIKE